MNLFTFFLKISVYLLFFNSLIGETFYEDRAILIAESNEAKSQYEIIKEDGKWKMRNMLLTTLSGASKGSQIEWIIPIDTQLRSLRKKEVQQAYAESSAEFKANTSLEQFIEFVQQHPILTSHQEISIKNQSFKDKNAEVTVILDPTSDAITVNYVLIKENNLWKIWGMAVVPAYSEQVQGLIQDPSSMHQVIEQQLKDLKANEVAKAYYKYSADKFKDTISLDDFRKFLATYPLLTTFEKTNFKEPIFTNKTTGYVEGVISGPSGNLAVEYQLGIEEDGWKIWSMRVLQQSIPESTVEGPKTEKKETLVDENESVTASSMQFSKVEVGTGLNLQGDVVMPSSVIKSPTGDIYVNLYIKNGIGHDRIDMFLEHEPSLSKLPLISTTLQESGDSRLSFSFTSPEHGWPKGRYRIDVESSTGAKKDFHFVIE